VLSLVLAMAPCTTGDLLQTALVGSGTSTMAPRPAGVAFAEDGLELPADAATTTLPLHVLAHLGEAGERVRIVLRWPNGIELSRSFTLLAGADGQGLLIANLDWEAGTRPALPASQTAVLQLTSEAGTVLGRRQLTILGPDSPALRAITLYFVMHGDMLTPVQRRIAPTPRIATAALEELLWGPAPSDPPDLMTAIPTPEDVLTYPGRRADWEARVQLRQVRIIDGVAIADFSREFGAYGGGSLRVGLIHQQLTRTLEQFPTVRRVAVAIEGQTGGVLEP
jgi:hypothetical protein